MKKYTHLGEEFESRFGVDYGFEDKDSFLLELLSAIVLATVFILGGVVLLIDNLYF